MTAAPGTIEQLARDASRQPNAEEALRALTALRRELDSLEPELVARALRAGSSWSQIAGALGVSKQAAHRKHRHVLDQPPAADPSAAPARILVTAEARRCVQLAREEARSLGASAVGTEHLLLGVLRCRKSHAVAALMRLGVTLDVARDALSATTEHQAASEDPDQGAAVAGRRRGITPKARAILEGALREAVALRDGYIGVEHLLLALLTDRHNGAVRTLENLGVAPDVVREGLDREWAAVAADAESAVNLA